MTTNRRAPAQQDGGGHPDERRAEGDDMSGNQGEGNRGAARAYNEDTSEFAQSGKAPEKAVEARRALEGPEGDVLRRAEEEGKSRAKGEDPAIRETEPRREPGRGS